MNFFFFIEINGLGELIDFILMVYEGKIMSIDKFQKLLIILSISHKGLTKQELLLLVKISLFIKRANLINN